MTEFSDNEMIPELRIDEHMQAQATQLLADSGKFLLLPEEIWQAAEAGKLPLEHMLLELPLSKWIVMVNLLNGKRSAQEWESVRVHLAGIRTRNDIRYDYLEMHMSNFWVSGILQGDSTESVERLLREYARANMAYARKVYAPTAFAEGFAVLPDSIRGAFFVEQALNETEVQGKKLEYLGKAAAEWPALAAILKNYTQLLGAESERQLAEAEAAANEMAAIALEVKAQILNLMDSGLYAEAYSVTEQLQQMTPEDPDLEALKTELRGHFS